MQLLEFMNVNDEHTEAIVGEIARGKGRELRATASDESLPSSLYPSPSTRKASDFAADAAAATSATALCRIRARCVSRAVSSSTKPARATAAAAAAANYQPLPSPAKHVVNFFLILFFRVEKHAGSDHSFAAHHPTFAINQQGYTLCPFAIFGSCRGKCRRSYR